MKYCIIAAFLAVLCSAAVLKNRNNDVASLIKNAGYEVETFDVITKDGYILDLYRISGRRVNRSKKYTSSEEIQSEPLRGEQTRHGKTVLLMHGFMSSSIDFVIGGQEQGLAFYLADHGYDVFLGNARGSTYGQRHTTLNPARDEAFWRFCWHDIGVKDLPAITDKIIRVTQESKISYIGHMSGTTSFYVLMSEKPEYNNKFNKMISMGPMAFMQNSRSTVLDKVLAHKSDATWVMKNLGKNKLKLSDNVMESEKSNCHNQEIPQYICANAFMNFYGYSNQLNETTLRNYLPHVPSGGSVQDILHFAQLKESDEFERYNRKLDSSLSENNHYDLTRVNVPVGIVYTSNDKFTDMQDVTKLSSALPKVTKVANLERLGNNLDLLFAENVRDNVFPIVKKMLIEKEKPQTPY